MNLDRRLSQAAFAAHGKRPWLDTAAIVCARELVVGEAATLVFVLARLGAALSGRAVRASDAASAGLLVFLIVFFAWGTAVVLELLFKRPRPYTAFDKKPLDHFWTPTPSMPSSHAAIAFALAGATLAVGPAWVPAAFLLIATAIAAGRVYVGVHYLSDVVAGAAVGFVALAMASAVWSSVL